MTTQIKRGLWVVLVLALAAACAPAPLAAPPPAPVEDPLHDEVEQQIEAELLAIAPAAVRTFQSASEAFYVTNDLAAAKAGFEAVLQQVPEFNHALRRLSYIYVQSGDVATGLDLAQRALAAEPSAFNHSAVAQALLATDETANYTTALEHARLAVDARPDDDNLLLTWLLAASAARQTEEAQRADEKLLAVAPWNPYAHYMAGLFQALDGNWEVAELELQLAVRLGMPADEVQAVLTESGLQNQARLFRWLRRGGYLMVAWVLGFGVLFVVGGGLSQLTLATVQRALQGGDVQSSPAERRLRALYRAVIVVASAYFYISIPFIIVLVLAGGALIGYLFLLIGTVPVYLVGIVIVTLLSTLVAVVRAVFTRVQLGEPGQLLNRSEAPELWQLVEDVARRMGTRPVDAIYISPRAEIAVTERGTLTQKLRDTSQRCLILGLGLLPGLTQGQLRSILAHEYGHFSSRDTAGGRLALQVLASVEHMAVRLARAGQAFRLNPAWLFLTSYQRLYLRITLGASRLQEILADRAAALAYGARDLVDGLQHVARQSVTFRHQVQYEVRRAVDLRMGVVNVYREPATLSGDARQRLEAEIDEELKRATTLYDSHPAMRDRLRMVQQLPPVVATVDADPRPAWDLLRDPERLQATMLAVVQRLVRQQSEA